MYTFKTSIADIVTFLNYPTTMRLCKKKTVRGIPYLAGRNYDRNDEFSRFYKLQESVVRSFMSQALRAVVGTSDAGHRDAVSLCTVLF